MMTPDQVEALDELHNAAARLTAAAAALRRAGFNHEAERVEAIHGMTISAASDVRFAGPTDRAR